MSVQDTFDELSLLVQARYALILLDTREIDRAEEGLARIASDLRLPFLTWTRSNGLRRGDRVSDPLVEHTQDPAKALALLAAEGVGLYHFREMGAHLDDPVVVSFLLDAVSKFAIHRGAVVLTGQDIRIPDALRGHATVLQLPPPSFDEYRRLLEKIVREQSAKRPVRVDISAADRVRLLNNLAGLTLVEAEKVLTKIIVEDAVLSGRDVEGVISAKRQLVEQDGLLEYHPVSEGLAQVAGLTGLKAWLDRRRAVVSDPRRAEEFGLSFPKGVLLLGVPGCGKSLCARAVAHEWKLPLLKLDPGNLFDRYIGDTEKNFKRAMQTAERMAPIVLWIDELEKAFAPVSGDSDGGVANRVFGSFLSWLQDRKADVFVVATSNDIGKLPPEFIRKGRFDEIFFVDLPGEESRREILRIHLVKRRQDVAMFDFARLAAATDGFTGAEIEENIVSSLYGAFNDGRALTTGDLLTEAAVARPLSRMMAERLGELRSWASTRTVPAG
ncbi:MAG: AAA family ATPase [Gemmatimonadaceae bacterium]|nr:AAA family ATPase [Gemmatimonadaceae bacterium]